MLCLYNKTNYKGSLNNDVVLHEVDNEHLAMYVWDLLVPFGVA